MRMVRGIGEPLSLAASELGYSAPAMFFIAEDLEILDCDVDALWTGRAVSIKVFGVWFVLVCVFNKAFNRS